MCQALLALSFGLGGSVGLAVAGQCLFMASFSIGSGPCSMMVASECFPLQACHYLLCHCLLCHYLL